MLRTFDTSQTYTPEQVAKMLQLSKNTVYDLIGRGEIVAKKFGKVYRIPAISLSCPGAGGGTQGRNLAHGSQRVR